MTCSESAANVDNPQVCLGPLAGKPSLKLHILSDLHFEYDTEFQVPETSADVLILAGDISPGLHGMARFARAKKPVIYVPGNHEFYGESIQALPSALRLLAKGSSIHLLDNGEVRLGGVRFLGTTLWTNYELFGAERLGEVTAHADRQLNDYVCIQAGFGRTLTPGQTVSLHHKAVDWLARKLDEPVDGKTVVVTHHAPHPSSLIPKKEGRLINAAYASDLTHLMGKACLWIHGHTHHSVDYTVNGTRIVTNPKGYRDENRRFDPAFTIEI